MQRPATGSTGGAPREGDALDLEVRGEALLDGVQQRVGLAQRVEPLAVARHADALRRVGRGRHDVAPRAVHGRELLALGGHLLHDVRRREDRLQVLPRALAREPVVEHVLQRRDELVPRGRGGVEVLDEGRRAHARDAHHLVVQQRLRTR